MLQVFGESPESKVRITDSPICNPSVRCFGDYELLGEIAQGGMGVVYYARQVSLGRIVALKMIRSGQLASEVEVQRFRNEAEAAANLDHPHIVPIYEVGECDGQHYFSMKLIEGGTLAEVSAESEARSAEWLRRAAGLLATIARAVHHAHQRGVLHRDLKPTNILLDEQGLPHLTDFGLAKLIQDRPNVTHSLAVLGTPGYMSPEQAAGRTKLLTTASDIYSLGAILFELFTGKAPFTGDSTLEILKAVQEQEPERPRKLNPAVDADLETICLKCLEKEPQRRYATAEALAQDLDRWRGNEPILARPTTGWERTTKWTRRNPVVASLSLAALMIFCIGLAGVVWQWRKAKSQAARADQNAQRADLNAAESRQRLARSHVANGNRLREAGNPFEAMLWFAEALRLEAGRPQEADHRLRLASTLRQSPRLRQMLAHGAPLTVAEFSHDGQRLISAGEDGSVRVWNLETGQTVMGPLNEGALVGTASFLENDREILTTPFDGKGARVLDAKTGAVLRFFEHAGIRASHLSANGNWMMTCGSPDGIFKLWNARTGELLPPVLHHGLGQGFGEFTPDGKRFVTAGSDGTILIWDRATMKQLFPPLHQAGTITDCFFTADGSRLVIGNYAKSFQIWDATTGQPTGPPVPQPLLQELKLGPDGWLFAGLIGAGSIRIWDAHTGNLALPELRHTSNVRRMVFDSTGRQLAVGCADGTAYLWDLTQPEPVCQQLKHGRTAFFTSFSSDDRRLAVASSDGLIRVWDCVPAGLAFSPWPEPPRAVLDVGSAEKLLTHQADGTMQIWETRTWQPASVRMAITNLPGRAWLGKDGTRLVVQSVVSNLDLFAPRPAVSREFELQTWEPASGRLLAATPWRADTTGRAWASPDARLLALARTNQITVLDTSTWTKVWERRFGSSVQYLAFSPAAGRAAILAGKEFHLIDVATGAASLAPQKVSVNLTYAEFSPDGHSLATASGNLVGGQLAYIWDVETGEALTPPLEHAESIWSIVFSRDGRKVATASRDRTARVWNAQTGQALSPPMPHPAPVNYAVFSPDSRWLATFCDDGAARLWDAATGEALTSPIQHSNVVGFGRFLGNGELLLTQSPAGTSALWRLPRDSRPSEDWSALVSLLAARRLNADGFLEAFETQTMTNAWNDARARNAAGFSPAEKPQAAFASQPTALPASSAPSPLHLRFRSQ
jgi:WD40 repeat protein/serine/threonine protein kinase